MCCVGPGECAPSPIATYWAQRAVLFFSAVNGRNDVRPTGLVLQRQRTADGPDTIGASRAIAGSAQMVPSTKSTALQQRCRLVASNRMPRRRLMPPRSTSCGPWCRSPPTSGMFAMSRRCVLIVFGIGATVICRIAFFPVTVAGNSMQPTLRTGDRLLARRCFLGGSIQTCDVVVLQHALGHGSDRLLIKRVVAIGGQAVPCSDTRVPAKAVYVRGDAPHSLGSRQLGAIGCGDVQGVVGARWWPVARRAWL
jgi:signal peptidase I